ncbi:hypothetical protein AAY473_019853 [Plecturocebus cupreus]
MRTLRLVTVRNPALADPGGLSGICPQPPVGPRGPQKPAGRSQTTAALSKMAPTGPGSHKELQLYTNMHKHSLTKNSQHSLRQQSHPYE